MAGLGVSDWTPRHESELEKRKDTDSVKQKKTKARPKQHVRRRKSAPPENHPKKHDSETLEADMPSVVAWRALSFPKEFSLESAQMFTEASREQFNRWVSCGTRGEHLSNLLEYVSRYKTGKQENAIAERVGRACKSQHVQEVGKVPISHWPAEDGYRDAFSGWQCSELSAEWLYKPAHGVYFHVPSESLWKRARGDRRRFVQIDDVVAGLECITIAAFGDSKSGQQALLRACMYAWRRQLRKFEDMDQDVSESQEGRMQSRPRVSSSKAKDRGDLVSNLFLPAATSVRRLFAHQHYAFTSQENISSFRSHSRSDRSSSPEVVEPVSPHILRLRRIAQGSQHR